ncbi:MAG TPA: TIGR03936 family radical SAM-associated protein [Acidimicrobiales bacterium]|nr:TIGR03936 family radical SAM-associated protein [Acidimicrobiales bacterium]
MSPGEGRTIEPGERVRIRIRFAKTGKIRWTSHRDLARMWERAFRRTNLPLAYSSGFSPRPKVSFGLALPTGYESVAEYIDVELVGTVDVATLPFRLSVALPEGVEATAAAVIPATAPSLQEEVTACTWRWAAVPSDGAEPVTYDELAARVGRTLAASELLVTRSRKGAEQTDDIRPGIISLNIEGPSGPSGNTEGPAGPSDSDGFWLTGELACRPRSIRPSEVILALGPGLEERHPRRLHQWIWRDGARTEPLVIEGLAGTIGARHAEVRAS